MLGVDVTNIVVNLFRLFLLGKFASAFSRSSGSGFGFAFFAIGSLDVLLLELGAPFVLRGLHLGASCATHGLLLGTLGHLFVANRVELLHHGREFLLLLVVNDSSALLERLSRPRLFEFRLGFERKRLLKRFRHLELVEDALLSLDWLVDGIGIDWNRN